MSRTYELILRNETDDDIAKEVGGTGGIQTEDKTSESTGGESSESITAEGALKRLFGYKTLKGYAVQTIGFGVSTVQLRTGSSEAQQRTTFAYNVAMKGVSILENVVGGAVIGGKSGGWIGALIGLTVGAASTAIDITQQLERLDMEKRVEDVSRDLTAQRATVSGSRYQNATQG